MIHPISREQAAIIDRLQMTEDRQEARDLTQQLFEAGFIGEVYSEQEDGKLRFFARSLDDGQPAPVRTVQCEDGTVVPVAAFRCA